MNYIKSFWVLFFTVAICSMPLVGQPTEAAEEVEFPSIHNVHLEVKRVKSEVHLDIFIKDIDNIKEVKIERASKSLTDFRQIKYLTASDLNELENFKLQRVDKYPLPAKQPSYYRVQVIQKDGVAKMYPLVLLEGV